MTERIKGQPGTPFEGCEAVKVSSKDFSCSMCHIVKKCHNEKTDTILLACERLIGQFAYWVKSAQAPDQQDAQDVTPTVPGWYWVRFGNDPVLDQAIELITSLEIENKTVYLSKHTGIHFSYCQFDGPIPPPARWSGANAHSDGSAVADTVRRVVCSLDSGKE